MEDSVLERHRNMEESFLLVLPKHNNNSSVEEEDCHTSIVKWSVLFQEVKRLGYIAGPLVAVMLSQNLLQVISMMMVGHLGELSLSSSSVAISLSVVTGFSIIVISMMMVGHLGELSLSGAAIAISLSGVTGFSLLEWLVHLKLYVGEHTELSNIRNLSFKLTLQYFLCSWFAFRYL